MQLPYTIKGNNLRQSQATTLDYLKQLSQTISGNFLRQSQANITQIQLQLNPNLITTQLELGLTWHNMIKPNTKYQINGL